jgi:hypothetical protein
VAVQLGSTEPEPRHVPVNAIDVQHRHELLIVPAAVSFVTDPR